VFAVRSGGGIAVDSLAVSLGETTLFLFCSG
jgi:hypothetical protein